MPGPVPGTSSLTPATVTMRVQVSENAPKQDAAAGRTAGAGTSSGSPRPASQATCEQPLRTADSFVFPGLPAHLPELLESMTSRDDLASVDGFAEGAQQQLSQNRPRRARQPHSSHSAGVAALEEASHTAYPSFAAFLANKTPSSVGKMPTDAESGASSMSIASLVRSPVARGPATSRLATTVVQADSTERETQGETASAPPPQGPTASTHEAVVSQRAGSAHPHVPAAGLESTVRPRVNTDPSPLQLAQGVATCRTRKNWIRGTMWGASGSGQVIQYHSSHSRPSRYPQPVASGCSRRGSDSQLSSSGTIDTQCPVWASGVLDADLLAPSPSAEEKIRERQAQLAGFCNPVMRILQSNANPTQTPALPQRTNVGRLHAELAS